jgi:hypothetical protein
VGQFSASVLKSHPNQLMANLADYPDAQNVFDTAGYEAWLESRPSSGEIVLIYRLKGQLGGSQYPIKAHWLPDPNDEEANKVFWDKIWHAIEIYPPTKSTQYTITSQAEWIPINQQQPDDRQPVLVYGEPVRSNGPRIMVATYYANPRQIYLQNFSYVTESFGSGSFESVSHWLPLPEPPL